MILELLTCVFAFCKNFSEKTCLIFLNYMLHDSITYALFSSLTLLSLILLHVISRIALLHTACIHNSVDKIQALIDEGLDVDAKYHGMTPFFTACQVCSTCTLFSMT